VEQDWTGEYAVGSVVGLEWELFEPGEGIRLDRKLGTGEQVSQWAVSVLSALLEET